jgi:hypothetical protein
MAGVHQSNVEKIRESTRVRKLNTAPAHFDPIWDKREDTEEEEGDDDDGGDAEVEVDVDAVGVRLFSSCSLSLIVRALDEENGKDDDDDAGNGDCMGDCMGEGDATSDFSSRRNRPSWVDVSVRPREGSSLSSFPWASLCLLFSLTIFRWRKGFFRGGDGDDKQEEEEEEEDDDDDDDIRLPGNRTRGLGFQEQTVHTCRPRVQKKQ